MDTHGLISLSRSPFFLHTHEHTYTLQHLIPNAAMQNILRLNTNAESMHMFDLL